MNILSCVHQHRGCDKRYQCQSQCQSRGFVGKEMCIKESKAWSVASIEIVGGWPIPCGAWLGLSSWSPSIVAIFPHLSKFRNFFPTNLLFLDVSCKVGLFLLKIWQLLVKEIPKTPFAKFAHDFVLKKNCHNKIKYHCTGGGLFFYKYKIFSEYTKKFLKILYRIRYLPTCPGETNAI